MESGEWVDGKNDEWVNGRTNLRSVVYVVFVCLYGISNILFVFPPVSLYLSMPSRSLSFSLSLLYPHVSPFRFVSPGHRVRITITPPPPLLYV